MTGTRDRIQLPRWFACLSDAVSPRGDGTSAASGVRIGPMTIFAPEQGVSTATFGAVADPGVVLFDGYLFERQRLRQELALPDDAPDARIAAAAVQRWRDDVFDRLDGSYLLAVWDPESRRLLLGHDALGHHPVFYAPQPGAFWFGSNVLALAHSSHIPCRADTISLALITLTKWPAAGHTAFDGIQRLRAGRYLTISRDRQVREHEYFSPWLRDGEAELTDADVYERFEPELVGAVNRCMALGPDGVMLSGGLDSVTIAALAADYAAAHHTSMIAAVSGRRDEPGSHEEPIQTATAAALGMRHLVATESEWMGTHGEVEMSLAITPELPAPSRIYWVGAYMAFYRHTAARQLTVLLTGSGGDNWIGVGGAHAAESLRRVRLGAFWQFVRSSVISEGLSYSSALREGLWTGGARVIADAWAARVVPGSKDRYHRRRALETMPAWLCPDQRLREQLADTLVAQRPAPLTPEGRLPSDYYRQEQRSVINPYYQYEFDLGFHLESACGLRLLSPYHDRRLVRFLNAVPPRVLLKGGKYKGLLRTLAQKRLPNLGLDRQRKDHQPAVLVAHRRSLRDGVLTAWTGQRFERLADLGIVDPRKVSSAFGPATTVFREFVQMYALMSGERWLDAHVPAAG